MNKLNKLLIKWLGNMNYPAISQSIDFQFNADIFQNTIKTRRLIRKLLKDINVTLHHVTTLYNNIHTWKHYALMHSTMVFEELPQEIQKRKEKFHDQRLDVSRMALRCHLPSDLVPLICAYAVPKSKIYDYM